MLPIMIVVMTAKWVGDALGTDGIYATWIAMRRYPWLPPDDFKDTRKDTGESIMKSADSLVKIEDGVTTVGELGMSAIMLLSHYYDQQSLDHLLTRCTYSGFPVVKGRDLVGFASSEKLRAFLCM